MCAERLALYTTIYPGVEPYLAEWFRTVDAQTDREFDLWIGLDTLSPADVAAACGRPCTADWVRALDATPAEALKTAREAADGKDVRIGGGPTLIRAFLAAGLVDHLHIVVVPILLGRGVRLWDGLEGIEKDYAIEDTSSPSGVKHLTFTRAR